MGIQGIDLNDLRSALMDDRVHFDIGQVESVETSPDLSVMRCKVKTFPDQDIIICRMSWEAVGPGAGFYAEPQPGDMVLFALADGDQQQGFILKRLSSKEDTIPLRVALGHWVLQALSGAPLSLSSDEAVYIDRGALVPGTEALVLGNVLKTAQESLYDQMIDFLDKIITGPIGIGNLGNSVPTDPTLIINLTVIKTQVELDKLVYVTTAATNWLSQIAFTER